jgi:hypothetical protein
MPKGGAMNMNKHMERGMKHKGWGKWLVLLEK